MHRGMWVVLYITVFLSMATHTQALELNKPTALTSEAQVKVNNALAKSYASPDAQAAKKVAGDVRQDGCGNTRLGTITDTRASRVDTTTVVRGSVTVVNRNVRCR